MTSPIADPRAFLRSLFDAAVARALPAENTAAWLPKPPKGRTLVLGAGKAGGAMAAAVDALWPKDAPLSGLVVTRYDHVPPAYKSHPGRIEVVEAAHPVPDEAGRRAAQRIAELAQGLTADDLVLCLISGGASALLAMPADGLTLEEKQAINKALLKSGAAIDEMNCVRKHLSAIKGGRLAARCAPARVVSLLISDVPGDAPEVIGSGPTVPDSTTCADALAILARYRIEIPPAARAGLESGAFEIAQAGRRAFRRACGAHDRDTAAEPRGRRRRGARSRHRGARPQRRDRRRVARGRQGARGARPVRGAARCAVREALRDPQWRRDHRHGVGQGGPWRTGDRIPARLRDRAARRAGRVGARGRHRRHRRHRGQRRRASSRPTRWRARPRSGLKAQAFLDRNDAYNFFAPLGDLVVPGPTFTNVNDFRALLVL